MNKYLITIDGDPVGIGEARSPEQAIAATCKEHNIASEYVDALEVSGPTAAMMAGLFDIIAGCQPDQIEKRGAEWIVQQVRMRANVALTEAISEAY